MAKRPRILPQNAPRWNPALMSQSGAHDPNVPLASHERPQARPEAIVSLQAHQPDDRPYDPNTLKSRHILLPADVTYTERKSMVLRGWCGIVAASVCMDNSGKFSQNAHTPIR